MILFLDTVSPLPEFSLIEDNKIIFSKEVLINIDQKMSDCIVQSYIDLEEKFSLAKNLKYLITNTGPGSYTALRVGIAFLSGLSLAYNINIIGLSCIDIIRFSIDNNQLISTGIYIVSANDQNFISFYNNNLNLYDVVKIELNSLELKIKDLNITNIYTNSKMPLKIFDSLNNIKFKKIIFSELINKNLKKIISLPKKDIIEPIYISNNVVLN